MNTIHNTVANELGNQTWSFEDKRLPEMLFRYRARNFPETLSPDEQAQWREHCQARLVKGESGHRSFAIFQSELDTARAECAGDEAKLAILAEVDAYGRILAERHDSIPA